MMKRLHMFRWVPGAAAAWLLFSAVPASAQVTRWEPKQAIGFNIGYFALRGEDARVDGDVLLADLEAHAFLIKDFNGAQIGGEWLVGIGDNLEAGVGVGFYQRSVPTLYRGFFADDGTELTQDFKLRVVPMNATVRFLPLGRGGVEPYIGVGVGVFNWRYSEVGDFIDFTDDTVFRARYVDSGTSAGPVVLGGIRFPVSDVWLIGGEARWQRAEGKLDPDVDFLGEKIDLGGWTTSFTLHLKF